MINISILALSEIKATSAASTYQSRYLIAFSYLRVAVRNFLLLKKEFPESLIFVAARVAS